MVFPDPEAVKHARSLAEDAQAAYLARQGEAFAELERLVAPLDPGPLLCAAMYFLRFAPWGSYYEPDTPPTNLDFEMLASLIATSKPQARRLVRPEDVKSVLLAAQEVARWARASAIATAYLPGSEEAESIIRSDAIRRFITVRGAAYVPHGRRFAQALIEPYEGAGSLGTTLSDTLAVADAYVARIRGGWVELTTRVWQDAESVTGQHPGSTNAASEEFMDSFVAGLLTSMPPLLMLTREDLALLLPGPVASAVERADRVLEVFGVGRGGWSGSYQGPLGDPPLRTKPFLLLPQPLTDVRSIPPEHDEDSLVLLVHHDGLGGDAHLTIDAILAGRVSAWPHARARVVDKLAVELLSERLPGSRSAVSVFYREEGREPFELDGVILYEDRAIVVEGKGAPLKLPSRRGDAERFKNQLIDALGGGWAQLERDLHIITQGGNELMLLDDRGRECKGRLKPVAVAGRKREHLGLDASGFGVLLPWLLEGPP